MRFPVCFFLFFFLVFGSFLAFSLYVCVISFGFSVFSFFGGVLWLLSCRFFLWLPLSVPLLPSGVRRIFLLIFHVVLCVRLCMLSVCLRLCFGVHSPTWAWVLVVALAWLRFRDSVCCLSAVCLFVRRACVCVSRSPPVEREDQERQETKRGWKKKKRTGKYIKKNQK